MKKFTNFLLEAQQSLAVLQARRKGLVSDGHGGWYDKRGEFTAKTDAGGLVFYNQNQVLNKQDPPQKRNPVGKNPVATQTPDENIPQDRGVLTVAFGRFNPPTIAHIEFLNIVAEVAGKDGNYKIYPSRTVDEDKNPLDPDTKISVMRKMFPEHGEKIINDENIITIFDVLTKANEDGFSGVNIVVGSERQSEFEKLATKYNGELYNFQELNIIPAGERDPDSKKAKDFSASMIRKAVAEGDYETFRMGIPETLDNKDTRKLYMILRKNMNLKEGWILWKVCPKQDIVGLRESYINNEIFKTGELVENLNTGLIGKIIRRGTNYLICVTENNIMFKSWIKDVKEHYPRWTNVSGVPADQREVGTDSFRQYTMKMTGTKEIKNFNIKKFINKFKKK